MKYWRTAWKCRVLDKIQFASRWLWRLIMLAGKCYREWEISTLERCLLLCTEKCCCSVLILREIELLDECWMYICFQSSHHTVYLAALCFKWNMIIQGSEIQVISMKTAMYFKNKLMKQFWTSFLCHCCFSYWLNCPSIKQDAHHTLIQERWVCEDQFPCHEV